LKKPLATLAFVLVLAGVTLASARVGPLIDGLGTSIAPEPLTTGEAANPIRVKVSGHVAGLYPGARRRMPTTVRNDYGSPVRLDSIRVRAAAAGPGCSAGNLRVRGFRGARRVIGGHRATRVPVRVAMLASAPDACQGARFPLRFRAHVSGRGKQPAGR
jgi:hypothetical protein